MITSYATLQSSLQSWMVKPNQDVTEFIQLAEARLKRDPRARKLQRRSFQISADDTPLPSDYQATESWYHDGPTYFGEIQVVPSDRLGEIKARLGTTGPPSYVSVIDTVARFAPSPDAAYTTKLVYWRKLIDLSPTNTTNWLLTDHPDIYLHGSLLQATPYLKDDRRLAVWSELYERALEELHQATQMNQFGGGSSRRHFTPIG